MAAAYRLCQAGRFSSVSYIIGFRECFHQSRAVFGRWNLRLSAFRLHRFRSSAFVLLPKDEDRDFPSEFRLLGGSLPLQNCLFRRVLLVSGESHESFAYT